MVALRNGKRKATSKARKKTFSATEYGDEDDDEFQPDDNDVDQNIIAGEKKKKIAPRSGLQFKVGPSFDKTILTHKVFCSSTNGQVIPVIHSRIDRGFEFLNNEWIGYKRNYFTLVASFEMSDITLDDFIGEEFYIINEFQERIRIGYFALKLVSTCSEDGSTINLIQHTAKRDRGPQFPPPIYAAVPGILPDHTLVKEAANVRNGTKIERINQMFYFDRTKYYQESQSFKSILLDKYPNDRISKVARYERIQFSSSINYRKPASNNRHFTLKVELLGIFENGQQVSLAFSETPPLVIRGRSPSNYQVASKQVSRLEKFGIKAKKAKNSGSYLERGSRLCFDEKGLNPSLNDIKLDPKDDPNDFDSDSEAGDSSLNIDIQIKKQIARFNEEYVLDDEEVDVMEGRTPLGHEALPLGMELLPFNSLDTGFMDISKLGATDEGIDINSNIDFADDQLGLKHSIKKPHTKALKKKRRKESKTVEHSEPIPEMNFSLFSEPINKKSSKRRKTSVDSVPKFELDDVLQFDQQSLAVSPEFYLQDENYFYPNSNGFNDCANLIGNDNQNLTYEYNISNLNPEEAFNFSETTGTGNYQKYADSLKSRWNNETASNEYQDAGLGDVSMSMPSAMIFDLENDFDHSKFLIDF